MGRTGEGNMGDALDYRANVDSADFDLLEDAGADDVNCGDVSLIGDLVMSTGPRTLPWNFLRDKVNQGPNLTSNPLLKIR
jgi:hypothetical protein